MTSCMMPENVRTAAGKTGNFQRAVHTGVTHASAADDARRRQEQERWQFLIDQYLIEIARTSGQWHDDDLNPPTDAAIEAAFDAAEILQSEHWRPADRIGPDGDGGIVFEWAGASDSVEVLEIAADGDGVFVTYPRYPALPVLR